MVLEKSATVGADRKLSSMFNAPRQSPPSTPSSPSLSEDQEDEANKVPIAADEQQVKEEDRSAKEEAEADMPDEKVSSQ